MADQQQEPNARSPLFQNRQQRQSNAPHRQFISSAPLPNPRQLFPDTSRSRRAFHQLNGSGGNTGASYGAINPNPMRINTAGANAAAHQSGYVSPGPGTPKPKQVPLRTTKVSQKLVLLPEEDEKEAEEEHFDYPEGPFSDNELDQFRDEFDYRTKRRGLHGRAPTQSEMLTKEQRNAKGLARYDMVSMISSYIPQPDPY